MQVYRRVVPETSSWVLFAWMYEVLLDSIALTGLKKSDLAPTQEHLSPQLNELKLESPDFANDDPEESIEEQFKKQ